MADDRCVAVLLRGATRYHVASLQDLDPLVAARHNGYAVALIDALIDLATEEDGRRVAGVSIAALRSDILGVQDRVEQSVKKSYIDLAQRGVPVPGLSVLEGLWG